MLPHAAKSNSHAVPTPTNLDDVRLAKCALRAAGTGSQHRAGQHEAGEATGRHGAASGEGVRAGEAGGSARARRRVMARPAQLAPLIPILLELAINGRMRRARELIGTSWAQPPTRRHAAPSRAASSSSLRAKPPATTCAQAKAHLGRRVPNSMSTERRSNKALKCEMELRVRPRDSRSGRNAAEQRRRRALGSGPRGPTQVRTANDASTCPSSAATREL